MSQGRPVGGRRGSTPMSCPGVLPSPNKGLYLGSTPPLGHMTVSGGTPLPPGYRRTMSEIQEDSLHHGWYASCGHASELSCVTETRNKVWQISIDTEYFQKKKLFPKTA